MIETPQIVTTETRRTAVIRLTIPRSEIQQVMGPAFGELFSTLAAQGIAPAGPVFSHHFTMDPEIFDFEVGVPIDAQVAPAGRVVPGELPAATVARTTYTGGYEGLGAAWGELMEWVATSGHEAKADLWETYLAGPESGGDPSEWRTELNRLLAK